MTPRWAGMERTAYSLAAVGFDKLYLELRG